jgi:hypothetical protein
VASRSPPKKPGRGATWMVAVGGLCLVGPACCSAPCAAATPPRPRPSARLSLAPPPPAPTAPPQPRPHPSLGPHPRPRSSLRPRPRSSLRPSPRSSLRPSPRPRLSLRPRPRSSLRPCPRPRSSLRPCPRPASPLHPRCVRPRRPRRSWRRAPVVRAPTIVRAAAPVAPAAAPVVRAAAPTRAMPGLAPDPSPPPRRGPTRWPPPRRVRRRWPPPRRPCARRRRPSRQRRSARIPRSPWTCSRPPRARRRRPPCPPGGRSARGPHGRSLRHGAPSQRRDARRRPRADPGAQQYGRRTLRPGHADLHRPLSPAKGCAPTLGAADPGQMRRAPPRCDVDAPRRWSRQPTTSRASSASRRSLDTGFVSTRTSCSRTKAVARSPKAPPERNTTRGAGPGTAPRARARSPPHRARASSGRRGSRRAPRRRRARAARRARR